MLVLLILIVLLIVFIVAIKNSGSTTPPPKRKSYHQYHRSAYSGTRPRTTTTTRPRTTTNRVNSRTVTPQNFTQKLNTLSDSQDVRKQPSDTQKRLVSEARSYTAHKRRTYTMPKETISVDLSWSENLAELLEATAVVYDNAQMNCDRKLVSERFHYYTRLHYRSFTAADLCYAKWKEITPHYSKVRKTVERLKECNDPLRVDKKSKRQLEQLCDTMGDICTLLRNRVDTLNAQTRKLKFKIRDECGKRGEDWFKEIEERIRQNSSKNSSRNSSN